MPASRLLSRKFPQPEQPTSLTSPRSISSSSHPISTYDLADQAGLSASFLNGTTGESPPGYKLLNLLRSFSHPMLSTIRRLTISGYRHSNPAQIEDCPILQTLSSTNSLRTLTLIHCTNLTFIFALDPVQNPFNLTLCPNLEEPVLYITFLNLLSMGYLTIMAKN